MLMGFKSLKRAEQYQVQMRYDNKKFSDGIEEYYHIEILKVEIKK